MNEAHQSFHSLQACQGLQRFFVCLLFEKPAMSCFRETEAMRNARQNSVL
jgi:hypothetical protein